MAGLGSKKNSGGNAVKRLFRRITAISFILFAVILVLIRNPEHPVVEKVGGTVMDTVTPIVNVFGWPFRKISEFASYVSHFRTVDRINAELEARVAELTHEVATLRADEFELKRMREQCAFAPPVHYPPIIARAAGQGGTSLSRSFILSAGRRQGVERLQAVVVDGNLAGQIVAVGERHSRMILVTDATSRISVANHRTGVRAFLVGNNSRYPKLVHLEAQDIFEPGDILVTSGMDGNIPAAIPVGVIGAFSVDDGIVVQPFVNANSVSYVRIIRNPAARAIRQFEAEEALR